MHLRAERRILDILFVVRYRDIAYMIQSMLSQIIKAAALRTVEVGRVSVLVSIHLLPVVVVRLSFVSIVAIVAVSRMVLLTSGMEF